MFRNFNPNKKHVNPTPIGCETTTYPKNIIVYAGAAHVVIINNVLKILFEEMPLYSISSKEDNCVSGILN